MRLQRHASNQRWGEREHELRLRPGCARGPAVSFVRGGTHQRHRSQNSITTCGVSMRGGSNVAGSVGAVAAGAAESVLEATAGVISGSEGRAAPVWSAGGAQSVQVGSVIVVERVVVSGQKSR